MTPIVDKAEQKATDVLTNDLTPEYLYHNLRHTQRVVANALEIVEAMELPDDKKEEVELALWFHDTGYVDGAENHEEKSCKIAQEFLEKQQYSKSEIEVVCQLIRATKSTYEPNTEPEKIIRDANSGHLAKKDFRSISEMLREELQKTERADYTPQEWRNMNIEMFRTQHRFYTDYAKENWQKEKDKNLRRLIKDRKKEKRLIKKEKLKAKFKKSDS